MALTAIKVMDLSIHGKESSVITALLNNEAVVESKLGALSVTTAKIAGSAVTTEKINDAAVTTVKINDSAVTTAKVNDGAIVDAKIGENAAITWSKMATNAQIYGTAQMDGNVTVGDSKVQMNATSGNVTMAGNLSAVDATLSGDLSAVDATLSGNLGAVDANLSGDLAAVDANLSGNVAAVDANLSGNLSAVDGTLSGALEADSASIITNASVGGDLTVTGNLIVNGTTTTVASTEVTVADRILHLNHSADANAPLPAALAGLQVDRGAVSGTERAAAALTWDEIASAWQFAALTGESTVGSLQAVKMGDLDAAAIDAASMTLSGNIGAVDGIFSGDLSAVDAALSGNLSAVDATLSGDLAAVNAVLTGDLSAVGGTFSGALAADDAAFAGLVTIGETLGVTGAVSMGSTLALGGNFAIATDKFTVAAASGNTAIAGTLDVAGAADFNGALDVLGAAVLRDTMNVMGAADFDSTLNVDGDVTMGADLTVTGDVIAASFAGDGSLLTALDADEITSGELADARLSANVMLRDAIQNVSGAKTFLDAQLGLQATAGVGTVLDIRAIGDGSAKLAILANGTMEFAGDTNLYRSAANVLKTDDKLVVGGDFNAMGNADLDGTLNVDGAVTLMSTADVAGNFSVATSKFTVAAASGNVYALGTLEVDGAAQFDSTMAVAGNFAVNTDKFTVAASTGNIAAAGNAVIDGSITAASLTTSGNATIGGNLVVNGTVTYVNSTNTAVKDKLIHLNEAETQGANDAVPAGFAGISINRGTVDSVERQHAAFVWDEANSRFKAGMLTADDATLTLADIQVDDLYAATLHGDGSLISGMTADQIAVTPAGNLDSTDIQAALEELQADLDLLAGDSSSSLGDLSDELDAVESALGFSTVDGTMTAFSGTNYIDGDTVRDALLDLDTAVDGVNDALATHIGLATDAHDASAISVVAQNSVAQTDVQSALENHEGRLDTIEAKAWRQVVLYSATGGETSLSKNAGEPAIPSGAATQVFIDGRKVFEGASYQYTVAAGGGSISFAALAAGQSVEILYFA